MTSQPEAPTNQPMSLAFALCSARGPPSGPTRRARRGNPVLRLVRFPPARSNHEFGSDRLSWRRRRRKSEIESPCECGYRAMSRNGVACGRESSRPCVRRDADTAALCGGRLRTLPARECGDSLPESSSLYPWATRARQQPRMPWLERVVIGALLFLPVNPWAPMFRSPRL